MTNHHLDVPTPPEGIRLPPGHTYDQIHGANGDLLLAAYTRVDPGAHRATLQVLGEIDAVSVGWFRDRLAAAITEAAAVGHRPTIYLDLHSVSFFSAAAAGLLAGLTAAGSELVVHRPSRIVSRVLALTATLPLLRVDPTEPPL
ncbi:STAS domain-containing protein [Cryptosporangium arvum]|uniref:Anti-anti-sigma regulatory factor (Antagonist of anti-sigma factor) n=1 Tax=Cryptosporangium arvum DSM 44712 TaxID=927661 RepID=A0A010ZUB2_9ACTN|nr:STAS domain-containing protein [Cryptosporangium arvum]EXG82249.1 anti-anti-sigma regulatory factor (antagonist of anti-sigma factor) [Cryptosporangium arvum DSM 44712]